MKCIQCGTDNNLKDRTANQGRCKNCGHPFVFEPTAMGNPKITDPMFAKAIQDLSLNNTLFFTSKQLFYLLEQRLKRKSFNIPGLIILYIFFTVWTPGFFGGILSIFIGNISYVLMLLIYNLFCVFYLVNKSQNLNNKDRKKSSILLILLGLFIISGSIFVLFPISKSFWIPITGMGIGFLSIYLGRITQNNQMSGSQESLFNRITLQQWLERWQIINGSIEKLLPSPQEQITPATVNSDIIAYSFDRLIVCDRSNIAQLLIANNFHFENNCAILSITGYPQSIFAITMEMLRRNPNLQVYALHDCTPRGLSLVNRLRSTPQWFADTDISIIDIGLTPGQVMTSKRGISIKNSEASAQAARQMSPEISQNLDIEARKWLESGNFVELESFTPKRLIQVLNRCIARVNNMGASGDNYFEDVDDTRDDIYLVQSFG